MLWRAPLSPRSHLCALSLLKVHRFSARRVSTVRCVDLFADPKDGNNHEGDEIQINGIVRSVRKQKKYAFAHVSDGTTERPVQAILTPQQADGLTTGVAIEISGLWKASPAKGQSHELQATDVRVTGDADPKTYPIQKKYHTPEFLRSIPHLRFRTPLNSLLCRFRSETIAALHDFFQHRREYGPFYQVQPPLITSSDCEGAGEVFTLGTGDQKEPFFRSPKYLTVSSQLHLEAYAAELGSVWTLSPTFRAEKSDTPRHLAEFYMLEVEVNHVRELDDIMDLAEALIRHIVSRLENSFVGREMLEVRSIAAADQQGQSPPEGDESVVNIAARWKSLAKAPRWERISYTKAMEHLMEVADPSLFQFKPSWSTGLQLEHEKYLVEALGKGGPLFVTDYPESIKPFYMLPSDSSSTAEMDKTRTVANFDLLFPHVAELIGGSLREHRLPHLISNMRRQGLLRNQEVQEDQSKGDDPTYPGLQLDESLGALQWYADLRRYGSAPHGGFGLGFDRLLAYLTGISNLRDVVGFPRYWGKADC